MHDFNGLKLERLSTNLTSLSPADFKEPGFAHITHLDVTSAKRAHWKALSSLPMLSHLAINETVDIDILRQQLQRCKRLEILLAVNGGHWHRDWDTSNIILDLRFVMMKICRYMIEGWVDGASGKEYMWEWAERISALKKSEQSALIRATTTAESRSLCSR
jgi:hypothetical protein